MTINTTKEVLVEAWRNGAGWGVNTPNLHNLDLARVESMDGSEADAKQLISEFQRSSIAYNFLVQAFHQRFAPAYDGEVGPATLALANTPRCPLPDHPPPPGASFHYDDPALMSAVARMQAATGSGSWPSGCYDTPGVHEIKVSYDPRLLSARQREWLPTVKAHNAAAVAAMGLKVTEVPVGEFANVRFYGRNFGGSTIGMAEFNSGTCGDSVFCTVSPSYGPNLHMFTLLCMHEFGHTMRFQHSNRFIMNPYIMDVPEHWVQWGPNGEITYQDVRYADGKRFFGGLPIGPSPPPPPPPGPNLKPTLLGDIVGKKRPTRPIVIEGSINVVVKPGQQPGTFPYIAVPTPGTDDKFHFEPKTEV